MTAYGFVIDNRRCIGCHACSVACKAENNVPVGAFRTWVKYIEKGEFPNTRRFFSVLRCNHCDRAPCITICPTKALFRRRDRIVDFDSSRCIGCKSCMQACPYDALYINPDTHTAEKCNYCSHRTEVGLQPACVIVCPTQAIIAGDLDDGKSEIKQIVSREQVSVRKPEQGTRPKVFYVGAEQASLTPTMLEQRETFIWGEAGPVGIDLEPKGWTREAAALNVYDVFHSKPWGLLVAVYLWTKSISAGVLLVAAVGLLRGHAQDGGLFRIGAPVAAILLILLTSGLLIADLKRPERFWYIIFKANPRSWVVRGTYILAAFGAVSAIWLLIALLSPRLLGWPLLALAVLAAGAAAGYSGILFGQAEGRDFWQSPLLAPHLVVQAAVAGAALLAVILPPGAPSHMGLFLSKALAAALAANVAFLAIELVSSHPNLEVSEAANLLLRGPLATRFWLGVILVGNLLPLVMAGTVIGTQGTALWPLLAAAGALALGGLLVYEDSWTRAGQSVPMS